jgi:cbb3-type cytochrome oxidase subunit 1
MIVLGQLIFAYNTYKTLYSPKPSGADVKAKAAREVKV